MTRGESSQKALGVIAVMDRSNFGLKLSLFVFGATEQLSLTLQYKNINAHVCTTFVKLTLQLSRLPGLLNCQQ